jgi:cardiolipin synthase
MKCSWQEGNRIQLLENGDNYYPALFAAIARAQRKVILETFIWFEDDVGWQLHAVLLKAARRGIRVEVLLDGYGSPDLSERFVNELSAAGVIFRYYDPRPRLFGMRTNLFRRMHRKIVVIDETTAFVGGINYSAEHMTDYGPEAKQDYAVQVEGPVVQDILQFELENLPASEETRRWWLGVATSRRSTATPGKRRRCLSGGIIKNIAMILNAIISRCWLTPAGK